MRTYRAMSLVLVLGGGAYASGCGDVSEGQPDGAVEQPDASTAEADATPGTGDPDADPGSEGPDLEVTDVTLDTTSVQVGEEATVTATVQNSGDESGEATLDFEVDGSVEESKNVTVDAPGEGQGPEDTEVETTFLFSRDAPGDYELSVNDVTAGTVTVEEESEADIVVVDARAEPTEVGPGENVTVTADVQNQGDADGEKTLDFTVDGAVEDSETVTVEAPGTNEGPEDTEVQVEFTFSRDSAGDYVLAVDGVDAGTVSVVLPPSLVETTAICFAEPDNYTNVTSEVDIAPGGFEHVRVECPDDGSAVIGGGARVVDFFDEEPETRMQYSRPGSLTGIPRLWLAGVSNQSGETRTVRVTAVCAAEPPGYSQETRSFSVPAGSSQSVFSRCPDDGSIVLGGGFRIKNTSGEETETRIQHGYPATFGGSQHQWSATVANVGTEDQEVEVRAICADEPEGYTQEPLEAEIAAGSYERVIPQCPDDGRAISQGGVRVQDEDGVTVSDPPTRLQQSTPSTVNGGARHQWSFGISDERSAE